ncbi:MAG: hypothetical protein IJH07_01780 [Ruminococcus sp.]|nr:hypothetical protein [Ruminococcus sp.]
MKKMLALLMALALLLSVSVLFASAEGEGTTVYVTIADKDGKLAAAAEKVSVTDIDGDNTLTINDALYAAHEKLYEGGAAAGYGYYTHKDYGLSLQKLWGDTSGNFSYQLNNGDPVWNLAQPVKADDYVAAYIYRDTKFWSDIYLFFDRFTDEEVQPGEIALTLSQLGFDEYYNTVRLPMEGAELTVDGEPTGVMTDAQGKASLTIETPGEHLVSAAVKDKTVVSPVYRVKIAGEEPIATPDEADPTDAPAVIGDATEPAATESAAVAPTAPATKDEATKDTATKDTAAKTATTNPKTGDVTMLWLWILIAGVCFAGVVIAIIVYKKRYAKK